MKRTIAWFILLAILLLPLPPIHAQDTPWTLVEARLIGDEMWQQIGVDFPDYAPPNPDGTVTGRWYVLLLSPDGNTLVGMGKASVGEENMEPILCRYGIDSQETLCVPFDLAQILWMSPLDAAWSPDGTRIAFHEDTMHRVLDDSDIWLLDVETLALTDITDDGQSGFWLDVPQEALLRDFVPLWSADGDLYFFRMTYQNEFLITALYRLPGGTGTPEFIVNLPGDITTFLVMDLARTAVAPSSTAENLRIAFIPLRNEMPASLGVWLIEVSAGEPTVQAVALPPVLQAGSAPWTDLKPVGPLVWGEMQLGWNADETQLAVYMLALSGNSADFMNYQIVDVETSAARPIFDYASLSGYDELADMESTLPAFGMIAPDRNGFIYVSRLDADPRTLLSASFADGAIAPVSGTLPAEIVTRMENFGKMRANNGSWGQTSASGRILYGDVLLTFE